MSATRPDGPPPDRTQVQAESHQTQEFSVDPTNPSGGTFVAGQGVPGYPFLSPPQLSDEIGRLAGYRVLKLLGEGGMGFVFRGHDPALNRPIAIKVMRPEVAAKPLAADRFLREGRAAAGLKSDHVITIHQADTANGVPFLAMEFLEGLPLDAWFKGQKKAVPLAAAVRVVRDTLRGLAAAHDKGLIHRDVKPANLWIEKGTGRVKVLDFGLTRSSDADDQLTADGAVVGTPAFMAPEQAGGKPVDPRADLFSVGVVMYTLLAGKNPFGRGSLMETLGAVGFETQPPVTTVRADLAKEYSDFLDRLLAKAPDGRPANAKAALQELAAVERKVQHEAKTVAPSEVRPFVAVPAPAAVPSEWNRLAEEPEHVPQATVADAPTKSPSKKMLIIGGGLFAIVLAVGSIVVVMNKDGTRAKIETNVDTVPDGQAVAGVGPRKADGPKLGPPDADRKAAAFVIGKGGLVRISGVGYRHVDELPTEPFRVHEVEYGTDADAKIVDGDLQPLFDVLRPLNDVQVLYVYGPITDAGLVRLADFVGDRPWTQLGMNHTRITDDGLKAMTRMTRLRSFSLPHQPQFTGAGLAHLKGMNLDSMGLEFTGLRDAELVHLKQLPNFSTAWLPDTGITDAGLDILAEIKLLRTLNVRRTKVTAEGVRKFRAALPECKVETDFDDK